MSRAYEEDEIAMRALELAVSLAKEFPASTIDVIQVATAYRNFLMTPAPQTTTTTVSPGGNAVNTHVT